MIHPDNGKTYWVTPKEVGKQQKVYLPNEKTGAYKNVGKIVRGKIVLKEGF